LKKIHGTTATPPQSTYEAAARLQGWPLEELELRGEAVAEKAADPSRHR
jgi:hypothetical protein